MKPVVIILCILIFLNSSCQSQDKSSSKKFTDSFMQDSCTFLTTGKNAYFILEPGYQLFFEGMEGKDTVRLVITVLNETKKINGVETRVVEENESVNGKTKEISRNYFAICRETGSVFYFGEDVDMYKDGKIESHEGAWIAEGKNRAGVMMPGIILLGARYYQEVAPGVAMDRVEITSNSETVKTPAGTFQSCVKNLETTPLEPFNKEFKSYAPGVGLVQDGKLMLVKYGYL